MVLFPPFAFLYCEGWQTIYGCNPSSCRAHAGAASAPKCFMDWRCQPFGNVRLCLRIKAAAAKRSPSQTFRYREKRRCVAAPKLAQSRRERENDWRPTKIYCLFSLLPYGLQALRVSSGNPPTDPVVVLVVATMGPISLSSSFSFFFPLSVCLFFKLFYSIYFFAFFLSSPLPSPQVLSSLSHTEREREREKKNKEKEPFFCIEKRMKGVSCLS